MRNPFLLVSGAPDPEDEDVERLWLLIGTNDSCDGGRCFSLPPSNAIDSEEDLVAACEQVTAAGYPGITKEQMFDAWKSYRDGRRLPIASPDRQAVPASAEDRPSPIRFVVNPSLRLVSYTATGTVRMKDAKEFIDAVLAHPDFRSGFNFIGDRRRMITARADEYARSVAALVEANRERLAPCRWAVLVPNPVANGMARMWGLMAGETGVTVQPFYELSEAVEWLGLPADTNLELFEEMPESQANTRW